MVPAYFCVPTSETDRTILDAIAGALDDFDLSPPMMVALSPASAADRDGAHVFALGLARLEDRMFGRGFFMDWLADSFPVTFVGRDDSDGTEVFDARGPARLYLTSRPGFIGGQLDVVGTSELSAVRAGMGWAGLRASAATLEGARLFTLDGGALTPVAAGPFANAIAPGIDAESDLWPIPARDDGPATAAAMTYEEATEQLNQVGAVLLHGGDLQQARTIAERVVAACPRMDRARSLHASVLQRLGDRSGIEQALWAALDGALRGAPRQRGALRASTVGLAAERLATHLADAGRGADAREVIERACDVLHPEHAAALRARARGRGAVK